MQIGLISAIFAAVGLFMALYYAAKIILASDSERNKAPYFTLRFVLAVFFLLFANYISGLTRQPQLGDFKTFGFYWGLMAVPLGAQVLFFRKETLEFFQRFNPLVSEDRFKLIASINGPVFLAAGLWAIGWNLIYNRPAITQSLMAFPANLKTVIAQIMGLF